MSCFTDIVGGRSIFEKGRARPLQKCPSLTAWAWLLPFALYLVQPVLAFWANALKHVLFPCRSRVFKVGPLEMQDSSIQSPRECLHATGQNLDKGTTGLCEKSPSLRKTAKGRRVAVERWGGGWAWQRSEREADQKLPALATWFQVSLQFLYFMKVASCRRHEACLQTCSAEVGFSDDQSWANTGILT